MAKPSTTSSAHTAAPWEINLHRPDDSEIVCVESSQVIAVLADDTLPSREVSANARLIAAAPELLEVCKEALSYFHRQGIPQQNPALREACDLFADLKTAIAKAEGKWPMLKTQVTIETIPWPCR